MASHSAASRWRHWAILRGMVALLGVAAGSAAAQDRACLQWDEPVTLEGFILDGVFPGPPEFESVEAGDERLEARFLYLLEPVCISGDGAIDAEPVEATELVQLACSGPSASVRGRTVSLTGTLFAAHTGYHWTAALLFCED